MKKKFVISFFISLVIFGIFFISLGRSRIFKAFFNNPVKEEKVDNGKDDTEEKPENKEILFLMMGVDSSDVKKSDGTRTDTMMLFKVNFDTGKIELLSLPRDTRVPVRGKLDKINHAHAYGGSDLTMQTVRDFLNIDLDYYVKVDYRAVREIVDAIGGVEIDVPQRMKYKDPTSKPPLNINIEKGLQVLDGAKAHDFLRYRSGYRDGDIGRVKAQQMFMKELVKQTLKPKNILKLPKLIDTYFDYVETNIPLGMIIKGAGVAAKIDPELMETYTVPGVPQTINGVSYWIYDGVELDAILNEHFKDYIIGY